MSTLFFDNFTDPANLQYPVYGDNYRGTAWKVGGNNEDEAAQLNRTHILTSIKIKVFRTGNPGAVTMIVQKYEVEDSSPVGDVLSTGSFDGDTITDDPGGETVEVQLTTAVLSPDTWYCFYIKAPAGDVANYINLKCQYE